MSKFNSIQEIAIALAEELIPFASTVHAGVKAYHKRKLDEAREVLLDALLNGEVDLSRIDPNADEVIGTFWRYYLARQKGAQTRNLKILANYIVGQIKCGSCDAEEFDALANRVESLSREELAVLAALYRRRTEAISIQEELIPAVVSDWQTYKAVAGMLPRSGLVIQEAIPGAGGSLMVYDVSTLGIALCERLNGSIEDYL